MDRNNIPGYPGDLATSAEYAAWIRSLETGPHEQLEDIDADHIRVVLCIAADCIEALNVAHAKSEEHLQRALTTEQVLVDKLKAAEWVILLCHGEMSKFREESKL